MKNATRWHSQSCCHLKTVFLDDLDTLRCAFNHQSRNLSYPPALALFVRYDNPQRPLLIVERFTLTLFCQQNQLVGERRIKFWQRINRAVAVCRFDYQIQRKVFATQILAELYTRQFQDFDQRYAFRLCFFAIVAFSANAAMRQLDQISRG